MSDSQLRLELFSKRKEGDEEFCCVCFSLMGFSKKRNVDDPVRSHCGAAYVSGVGQVCAQCNKEENTGEKILS